MNKMIILLSMPTAVELMCRYIDTILDAISLGIIK